MSKAILYKNNDPVRTSSKRYRNLLEQIDRWFSAVLDEHKSDITCSKGCSECCRGLFDITLLDAILLREGFNYLSHEKQLSIIKQSGKVLTSVENQWGTFPEPYILNIRQESDWNALMPDDDETPCVFLNSDGSCSVYKYRPMTCRLHGIPLIDASGEVVFNEWCSLNFTGRSPLDDMSLSAPFNYYFSEEVAILCKLTESIIGTPVRELDTFIPFVSLVDYEKFDWENWFSRISLVENAAIV